MNVKSTEENVCLSSLRWIAVAVGVVMDPDLIFNLNSLTKLFQNLKSFEHPLAATRRKYQNWIHVVIPYKIQTCQNLLKCPTKIPVCFWYSFLVLSFWTIDSEPVFCLMSSTIWLKVNKAFKKKSCVLPCKKSLFLILCYFWVWKFFCITVSLGICPTLFTSVFIYLFIVSLISLFYRPGD